MSSRENNENHDKPYTVMLYNDEVHTYEEVEKMLKRSINAQPDQAKGYAMIIDRMGRTLLKEGTKTECENVQRIIVEMTQDVSNFQRQRGYEHQGPIKSLIIDRKILALQEFAWRLLRCINHLTSQLDILRSAFTKACAFKSWSMNFEIEPIVTTRPSNINRKTLGWIWSEDRSSKSGEYNTLEVLLLSDIYTWKQIRLESILFF